MRRRIPVASAALAAAMCLLGPAARTSEAQAPGTYRLEAGGRVFAVRILDVDGNARPDVVALVGAPDASSHALLVLRTPDVPVPRRYYPPDHVTRIPCEGDLARAGCVAIGRFGTSGAPRLRFLTPSGIIELAPDGTRQPATERLSAPTLFGRSPRRPLVFWDAVADLDGDGIDELWYPLARGEGPMQMLGGRSEIDRVLTLAANNVGSSTGLNLLGRTANVPNLFPADLEGDGFRELVGLRGTELLGWTVTTPAKGAEPVAPSFRLHLPFLEPPDLGPEDLHTPRVQLADVDGDGVTDLLVTLVTGQHSRVESLRTIFFHYPGPFRDAKTGGLVKPRVRIDTQSVALHPSYFDMDGDGDLEYVGDSIRGSRMDLIARVLGQDPAITYVGFRFDEAAGTFERTPYFTVKRVYPSAEALSNRFGRSGRLDGDFDGDGHTDLLDLGSLEQVEVLRGVPRRARGGRDPVTFEEPLVRPVPVKEGLVADTRLVDLNADGRTDAVLWGEDALFFLVSKGGR